jgi:UDP-N-acetylglucosamine--N-acetylmuramyl-(pentapeptide) pyrophosphoryl-undecaprenol N-acetylglucosamine transferase
MSVELQRCIAVAGGGTAGHALAGVAISRAYREIFHAETFFIGCAAGFESRLAPARGEDLVLIPGSPYERQALVGKTSAIVRLAPAVMVARGWLKKRHADLLVSVGGYPAMSAALAARSLGIPVVIHEANAHPGLANQAIGRFADYVCTGFEETVAAFRGRPVQCTGNPPGVPLSSTQSLSTQNPAKRGDGSACVLIAGGSEGSPFLNREGPRLFAALARPGVRVRHLAGRGDVAGIAAAYRAAGVEAHVDSFIDDMDRAYAAASCVIACPGALTLAEIALMGLPSLLVPLSTASGNHQAANARAFCAGSGASWVNEQDWNTQQQAAWLRSLLDDPARLADLGNQARRVARPSAAAQIVQVCESLLKARAPRALPADAELPGGLHE